MENTFEFDVESDELASLSEEERESSWFNVSNLVGHEKKKRNVERKSLRSQILMEQQVKMDIVKENREPAAKRTKVTHHRPVNVTKPVQKETKGFAFVPPRVKSGNSTVPQPFNFMKREEERKRLKMLKENGKGATEVDDVVTMKSGNLFPSKEQPKKRSFSTSRLNELAKPKPKVRPRIQDDIQLPKKVQHKMKLESVLAPPPPLQKSTRPTTKVISKSRFVC